MVKRGIAVVKKGAFGGVKGWFDAQKWSNSWLAEEKGAFEGPKMTFRLQIRPMAFRVRRLLIPSSMKG
jgi:hypothetical protein